MEVAVFAEMGFYLTGDQILTLLIGVYAGDQKLFSNLRKNGEINITERHISPRALKQALLLESVKNLLPWEEIKKKQTA